LKLYSEIGTKIYSQNTRDFLPQLICCSNFLADCVARQHLIAPMMTKCSCALKCVLITSHKSF